MSETACTTRSTRSRANTRNCGTNSPTARSPRGPGWARDALADRPQRRADVERWDRTARTLARYRIAYGIPADATVLGPPPSDTQQRRDYEHAQRAVEQLGRALGRDTSGREIDLG